MEKYFTPAEAFAQLNARRPMQHAVEAWLRERNITPPPLPEVAHRAILARHVATARGEDIVFMRMARAAGFTPVWAEYVGDHYAGVSSFKRGLLRPQLMTAARGVRGYPLRPVTPTTGQRLDAIRLKDGTTVVDWHRQRHLQVLGPQQRIDWTSWYKSIGSTAMDYYAPMLATFVAHAVLFEDYSAGESGLELERFRERVFMPAYTEVCDRFGVAPLLTKMPWGKGYDLYPESPDLI